MGAPRAQIITEARASGAPVIERSLHFDNLPPLSGWSENPYQHLYKRMPRYGNDRCFTYSCWFKRDQIYGQQGDEGLSKQYLIASEGDTSGSFIRFNNDNGADTLRILGPNSDLITEANFRDTIGWYHVVVAVDTTQATAADRVKLYVNGIQHTQWWSSGNTFPPQNQDYTFFDEVNHLYIGYSTTDGPNHNTFRGNMSEVYMLPGAQLPPTEFGFEDPLTGTWRPKKFNFDQQYQAVFNAPFSSIPSTDSSGNSITISDPSSGGVSVASAGSNNFGITNALDFGGGNDDLIVCGSSAFDGTGTIDMSSSGYTIDFYLKADGDLASGHSPLSLYFDSGVASGDRACRFYMDGGNLAVSWSNTGSDVIKTGLDTNWHHVRFSGSGIWFDGTYSGVAADFTRMIGLNTAVRVLYGGYNSVTANTYKWKGMLGPLRIMNGDLGAPPSGGLVTNSGNLSNIANGGPSGMSLYLPFDGVRPIGENRRRDPSFDWDLDPINFGGTKTTEEATGGFPIYNTINGGRTIVPGIRGQAGIAVTVYNSKYYLDGEEAPSLSKHRGQTITFDTSDSTVSGHPFRFATAADAAGSTEYTKSIVTGAAEASVGAATTITFPHDAPNTLYYYCSNHNGMGGSIGLSTDHKIADPCAWKCMFATPLLVDQNDVSPSIAATISSPLAVSNNNVTWPQAQSNYGNTSGYFVNSSSAYLTPTYHDDAFEFTTMGDFTIEGWFYHTAQVSGGSQIFGTATSNTYQCGISVIAHGGYPGYCFNVEFNANSPTRFRSKEVIPLYQWHHFAFCRSGGTGYLYVDGTMQESKSLTVTDASNVAYIGRPAHDGGAYRWNGYLQDFRIYNGVAKYTENFIPASTYPSIIPDSPSGVVHSSALAKYTNGSVSFDATGDYLELASSSDFAYGTGDLTIECWIYPISTGNDVGFPDPRAATTNAVQCMVGCNSSLQLFVYVNGSHLISPSSDTAMGANMWHHVVYSRSGSSGRLFLDGKAIGTATDNNNYVASGMKYGWHAWNGGIFKGHISNARIVKGTAVYTQDFTPPSGPLTNITNTKLLCCQNKDKAWEAAVSPNLIGSNNGTLWSDCITWAGGTGFGYQPGDAPVNLFDGDTSTLAQLQGTSGSNSIIFTPPTGISYSSTVKVYISNTTNTVTINDGSAQNVGSTGWYTAASGSGTLTKITVTRASGGSAFNGIMIDDVWLLDPVSVKGVSSYTSPATATTFNPFDDNIDTVLSKGGSGYCQMNSLAGQKDSSAYKFYNGNLRVGKMSDEGWTATFGTVSFPPRGKWQWEFTPKNTGAGQYPYNVKPGWIPVSKARETNPFSGDAVNGILLYGIHEGGVANYTSPAGQNVQYGEAVQTPGKVITLGIDFDNGIAKYSVDGVHYRDLDLDSTFYNSGDYFPCMFAYYGDTENYWAFNFGQRPFQFSFGEDYKAICRANMTSPGQTRVDPGFKPVLYTGNGNTQPIDVGWKPDLTIIKVRNENGGWRWNNSVLGAGQMLASDSQDDVYDDGPSGDDMFPSFNHNGFTVKGTGTSYNKSASTYVSYNFKAGGSEGTFNVDDKGYSTAAAAGLDGGAIDPSGASVGTKYGFGIYKWSGTGSAGWMNHGLGAVPTMHITKSTNTNSTLWYVYHKGDGTNGVIGKNHYISLGGAGTAQSSAIWGYNAPTSTGIYFHTSPVNVSGQDYITYAWTDIPGVQKAGQYRANNSADGTIVDCGFKPELILVKCINSSGYGWLMQDIPRNKAALYAGNPIRARLYANITDNEYTSDALPIDFLSTGFKARGTNGTYNGSNYYYLYFAWGAEAAHNLYGAQSTAF